MSLPEALSIPLSLGGTAGSPEDYGLTDDDTITIAARTTTATTTLRITPLRDNLLEEEETIIVDSVLEDYEVTPAIIALQDPSFAAVTTSATVSVVEGMAVNIGVTIVGTDSVDPQGTVTVPYILADGTTGTGVDYEVPSGELLLW